MFTSNDCRHLRRLFALLFVLATVTASQAAAAAQDSMPADFYVQGEYMGQIRMPEAGETYVRSAAGLQVVALGNGAYQAKLYRGGLPGTGWDRSEPIELTGALGTDRIELRSEDSSLMAWMDPGKTRHWHFVDQAAGQEMGTLSGVRRQSHTLGLRPPHNAMVLFDGMLTDNLVDAQTTEDGLLDVGFTTREPVRDFKLHVEFRTPYEPEKRGQGRGNSGVYVQRRYEIQVLDSFGLNGEANECGGLYRQRRPDLNMALPPMSWQTYDIDFRAARFDDEGNKTENARITVRHNGIKIHDDVEIAGKTGAGRPEADTPLPIHFQNHSNPVRYRNLWIVMQDDGDDEADQVDFEHHVETDHGPIHRRFGRGGMRSRRRCVK